MRPAHLLGIGAGVVLLSFPTQALAQQSGVSLELPNDLTSRSLQLIAAITVLSLAPGILMMVTCFPFLVTVLSILRQGIGLQQAPPNMLIVSLALFLTYYVMDPVFRDAWQTGVQPMLNDQISPEDGVRLAFEPFRDFMSARVEPGVYDRLAELRSEKEKAASGTLDLSVLIPSFLLSEIERAFKIGFLIFLPFLVIDLVVAAVLMAMGMMMVPPSVVSLPFKLAFFVVADGWTLLAESLVRGYQ